MHLEKAILKGKKFTPSQLKKEAKSELKEARSKALNKKMKC